jgi:glycosyltransferase involved in cell wall biosynthesis
VYDTLCLDRGTFGPRSPIGRVARWLDVRSLSWAKRILTDTPQQANFLAAEFGVPLSKFVPIPVGADESLFYPRPDRASEGIGVLYYSTYLPLHGAHVVIEAARLLDGRSDVSFTLIGNGPERARVEGLAKEYRLTNCTFIDWMAPESLSDYIAGCDSFLGGHFNAESAKARRVVPGKVYQGLAMAKPVIVGDCEAGREWFQHGENAYVVPMGDPEALADAILELSGSARLRGRIGKGGRALYQEHFSEAAIAARLDECIAAVLGSR